MKDFKELLTTKRRQQSEVANRRIDEEIMSDRSRIIYSSSFRRLQQKAQVFSLESNSNVRSRLIHSLEVSDVGRILAKKISNRVGFDNVYQSAFIGAVENACYLHDIGNPPFGHFGETAIRNWFVENGKIIAHKSLSHSVESDELLNDFIWFDGNPQGLRTALKLHCERDKYSLNLTYTGIASMIKYPSCIKEQPNSKIGYFKSEKTIIDEVWKYFNLEKQRRYILSYLMEAADDIAYSTSDIQDGIEKGVISIHEYIYDLKDTWKAKYSNIDMPFAIEDPDEKKEFYFQYAIPWSRHFISKADEIFQKHIEEFILGNAKQLFDYDIQCKSFLDCIKIVSRKKLYRSAEAENIELAGYKIIFGLLDGFIPLLKLPKDKFNLLIEARQDPDLLKKKDLDLEWRIFNKLGARYIDNYKNELKDEIVGFSEEEYEWFIRAHLIVDYIAGMTDKFAMDLYQLFQGIKVWTRV